MATDWYGAAVVLLLDASLRIFVLAALIWVVLACARVRSSAVRHRAWTAALVAMLLMPVLPSLVPAVRVPVPADVRLVGVAPDSDWVAEPAANDELPAGPSRAVASTPGAPAPSSTPGGTTPRGSSRVSVTRVALMIYFAGALASLAWLVIGWRAAVRLVRAAVPAGVPGALAVLESAAVATPLTVGVFSPRVLLPADWRAWPADKLRAVLAHERAHVRRRDPLVACGARVNRCLFWFHPVSWWLERRLAADAEHACDDAAVKAIGQFRPYAEVLLDMAEIVRQHRGRLVWQGQGVDGSGLLGERIDRILRGEVSRKMSRLRTTFVAAGCAVAIITAVACQRQSIPAPLRENPEVAQNIALQKADEAFYERARAMTAPEIDALEAKLNPDDLDGWKTLKTFYQANPQKVFGWNTTIARRRPHVVWLIEHKPEDSLAVWRISPASDPNGYAAASKAWRAQAEKKDATARTLSNTARFFAGNDNRTAEQLLLRAKALDPEGTTLRLTPAPAAAGYWSRRLGEFYGDVLVAARSPATTSLDDDPFAKDVRARMLASDDAAMLAAAGTVPYRSYFDPDRWALARQLLGRALQIDPGNAEARRRLFALDDMERTRDLRERLHEKQAELAGLGERVRSGQRLTAGEQAQLRSREYEAVSSLPEPERLDALVDLADNAYMWAEHLQYTAKDEAGAQASWERSKKAAQDALALAPKFRDRPNYGDVVYRATVALALHALREGDRKAAVRYMLDATNVPSSEPLAVQPSPALSQRLVNYLLKEGERASVAEFLERSAALRTSEREGLLKDAAAIRAGEMPMSYQAMTTRG